jgi:hypothetical protein
LTHPAAHVVHRSPLAHSCDSGIEAPIPVHGAASLPLLQPSGYSYFANIPRQTSAARPERSTTTETLARPSGSSDRRTARTDFRAPTCRTLVCEPRTLLPRCDEMPNACVPPRREAVGRHLQHATLEAAPPFQGTRPPLRPSIFPADAFSAPTQQ